MPVWTDTHDEADPADTDNISDGAREMRQDIKRFIRERLNDFLTSGSGPVPPLTIVDTDTRIGPGVGGLAAPAGETADTKMISGDRVDLRGCTYRHPPISTDVVTRATPAGTTTFSPIGNPGGAPGTGAFQITRTPVSNSSLFICILTGMASMTGGAAGDTFRGDIRIRNTTAGITLTPQWSLRLEDNSAGDNLTHGNFVLIGALSSLTGANRFEPQFATGGGAGCVLTVRGDLVTTHFRIIELV